MTTQAIVPYTNVDNPLQNYNTLDLIPNIARFVAPSDIDRWSEVSKVWERAMKNESVHQRLGEIFGVNLYPDLRPFSQQLEGSHPFFYSPALKEKLLADMGNPAKKNRFPLPLPDVQFPVFVLPLPVVQNNNPPNDHLLP